MNNKLNKAIDLRKNGDLKESNQVLSELVKESPDDALYNYQYAWSFDILGCDAFSYNSIKSWKWRG